MGNSFDIDIDLGNRDALLSIIENIPAAIKKDDQISKHNTGVYVTDIPYDPFNHMSSIDYKDAEELGYIKFDFLNVNVYSQVKDLAQLDVLINTEPKWEMLDHKEFVDQLIHLNGQFAFMQRMPEKINSIPRLAMFLAIIRPSKRYLIGKTWKEVAKEIWEKPSDGAYHYKMSHAIAYAHLVAIHINLLCGI